MRFKIIFRLIFLILKTGKVTDNFFLQAGSGSDLMYHSKTSKRVPSVFNIRLKTECLS